MKPKPIRLYFRVAMMLLMLLTSAQMATAQEAAVYDLVTEVPTVDGGQATNMQSSYDYGSLVDGNTSTKYYLSNADPWVEFHYSQAFVPKKYVLWTAFDTNNNSYRNPASWTIMAKLNKTDAWTTIATAENSGSNQLPTGNTQSKEYSIESNTNAYKYFRFEATGLSNHVQLGELQFKVASAKTEVTWKMYSGGVTRTVSDNSADFANSEGNVMRYVWTGSPVNLWGTNASLFSQVIDNQLQVKFPYLTGKVTKVELKNVQFSEPGMTLSIGNGTATLKTGNNSEYFASTSTDEAEWYDISFTGEINVDASNYLRFTFAKATSGTIDNQKLYFKGTSAAVKVTLEKAKKADLGHTFTTSSITASGNVLTATCTSDDADHVALYGASHRYTLTLNAADGMADFTHAVNASTTPAVGDFNEDTQLGATCTVEYAPQGTPQNSSSWTTSAPYTAGNYTARATVRINSTDYYLTTNFSVIEGYHITNNYPQFSVNKTGAMAGENITVTFTPKMGESLTTLTVTGDNTSLSLTNGITDNGDNTYTFAMPNENVTLGGTFTFPMNADNFAQDGDTYTIKNADGWDYLCQRIQYDANLDGFSGKTVELAANISVTTMAGMVHPFKGTFDGKGKTLTFNRTADAMYTAPFQNTNGATIKNLHVAGTITGGTNSYISGLVGSANGNLTIRDCHVSTQISTTFDSNTLSANVGIGGFVGLLSSHYDQCHITGCVFDGLIYNPNTWNQTYGCGGFIGAMSQYGYAILEDCLFIEGQYDNNGNKCELLWGYDNNKNSTFFHRSNNQGEGTLKNCFFVATHFLKQGSPAVESATAPTNFAHLGTPTDLCFMKTYGRLMLFNEKYYTPTYGDLVETYDFSGVKSYNIEYDDKPLGIRDVKTQLWTRYLRYKRAFTNGKPATVMLPFNFTKNDLMLPGSTDHPTGKFYKFVCDTHWLVLNEDNEVTSMKANTPYIYVPGEDTDYWYIENDYNGINIFTEGYDGGTKEVEYGNFVMRGTYTGMSWSAADTKTYTLGDYYGDVGYLNLDDIDGGESIRPTECYVLGGNYMALADNADNSDDIEDAAESGEVYDAVTLQGRTLYKDGTWNTLCLPFAVSTESGTLSGDNAEVLVIDGETSNLTDGVMTVNFKAPTGTTIAAGTPFIIKWDAAGEDIVNPVFTGVTIATTTAGEVEFTGGKFTGTFSPVSSTDGLLLDAHNANGGAFHATLSIDVPALDGFEGWYTDATLTTAATTTIPFAEDGTVKLYAKIAESAPATTYTITDVSGTDAQGTLGFYSDQACSTAIAAAAEGATVYIKVTPNSGYQLGSITAERTVASDGADSRRSESIPKGEPMAVTLVAGTTDVYQLTMPDGNVQVAATFTPITYSIEYELFGGTVATPNPTEYTVESEAFTLNNPTLAGYTFGGWTGSNSNTPQTEVTIGKGTTGTLNYKAVWYTEATVKVVWDDMNDHDLLRPASVVATLSDGKQVTLNNGNNWTAKVENLPVFDADGQAIVYTWTGSEVTDYIQSSTEADGITTLTYSHTPALEFTFATGQTWMTWCGSEAYTLPTGLEAYTVSGLSEDGTKVVLELQESILANTPMLLKGTAGETYTATPTAAGTADGLASTTVENVLTFYGNPTDAVITTGGYCVLGKSYVLYKGAFVLVDTDNGIPAHKCLLTLSSAVTARLSLLTDDATDIATTPGPSSPEEGNSAEYYDLHGRKLSGEPTKHGIYIYKGEKRNGLYGLKRTKK